MCISPYIASTSPPTSVPHHGFSRKSSYEGEKGEQPNCQMMLNFKKIIKNVQKAPLTSSLPALSLFLSFLALVHWHSLSLARSTKVKRKSAKKRKKKIARGIATIHKWISEAHTALFETSKAVDKQRTQTGSMLCMSFHFLSPPLARSADTHKISSLLRFWFSQHKFFE